MITDLAVISDLHVGCQLGLCHPDGARFDNHGIYKPNALQLKLWNYWKDYWSWVRRLTKGRPLAVVINGDTIDGSHHGTTTQWSHNLEDQVDHAYQILKPIAEMASQFYMIRGTEAHVGQSGCNEEALAKRLGAIRSSEGQAARWELWKRIADATVHFTHHIGTTSSSAHETSAVNAELSALFTDAGRWGRKPPRIVCRSHRHRSCMVTLPAEGGDSIAFVTPGWQLKTGFVYKLAQGRATAPQIGGSLIRKGGEGDVHVRHFVRDLGVSVPE